MTTVNVNSEVFKKICEVYNKHDLMQFYQYEDMPENEYDIEVEMLLSKVDELKTENDLTRLIGVQFKSSFSTSISMKRVLILAKDIWVILKEYKMVK